MYLFFDTETTGLPKRYTASASDVENWPRVVQLAWRLCDADRRVMDDGNVIIKPVGFSIPPIAARIHGITTERAERDGVDVTVALKAFSDAASQASVLIAHNLSFDEPITHAEFLRCGLPVPFRDTHRRVCTMRAGKEFCRLPSPYGYGYKLPKLTELHTKLFGVGFEHAHDARADVAAGIACFFALQDQKIL